MRWSPLRLTQKRWKAAYIVGGLVVTYAIFSLINQLPFDWFTAILTSAIQFVWIYFATRIFRGRNELQLAPRDSWRMTARPTAGYVLGGWWTLLALSSAWLISDGQLALGVTGLIEFGVLSYLYFASSSRLRRTTPTLYPAQGNRGARQ